MTLLRCSLCAERSSEEVETILGMFERAGRAVGIISRAAQAPSVACGDTSR